MTLARFIYSGLHGLWRSALLPPTPTSGADHTRKAARSKADGLFTDSTMQQTKQQATKTAPTVPLNIPTPTKHRTPHPAAPPLIDAAGDGAGAGAGPGGCPPERRGGGNMRSLVGPRPALAPVHVPEAAMACGPATPPCPGVLGLEVQEAANLERTLCQLQQLLQMTSLLEVKLQSEAQRLAKALRNPVTQDCPVPHFTLALGSEMARLGCRLALRKASDSKQYWSKSLRNTFALCILPGASGKPVGVIVDPNFKEHFWCSHMTLRYRAVWDALPAVFVGQATQLVLLTQLLCKELALKFESVGQVAPPWRAPKSCLGRWLSSTNTDIMVPLQGPCMPPTEGQAAEFLALATACSELQGSSLPGAAAAGGRGSCGYACKGAGAGPACAAALVMGFEVGGQAGARP